MNHWRFINNWAPFGGIRTFVLANVWWHKDYRGFGLLNFSVEWSRKV
jgi:hypothetical protein